MTWKVINIGDTGTSIKFGANDTDKINKLFSNVDVDDVEIASDWKFSQTTGTLLKEISEPATPASGYATLYVDSGDGRIKIKKDTGDVVVIE